MKYILILWLLGGTGGTSPSIATAEFFTAKACEAAGTAFMTATGKENKASYVCMPKE